MVLPVDIPLLAAGSDFGGYRLLREIGRGGMAVVYEAEEIALRRRVAVKVFHPRFDPSADDGERFLREAEAAGRLTHPAVVRVFGRGITRGIPYIVTEFIHRARDLESIWEEWCNFPARLPGDHVRQVAAWIADVAEAVAEAHAAGVLHRDLKPANLLIDGEGRVRLVDFGLASIRDRVGLSRTGEMSGTPFYMCPEQVRRGSFSRDGRCDVYSLGATLYQLLCLRRPVEGETPEQVFHSILHREPVDPRKLRPQLPRDLSLICRKAMEKELSQRYDSMADFASDLRRFLRYEPVSAQPPGWIRRTRNLFKRHPRLGVGALVGTVSLAALGLGAMQLAGAEDATRQAEENWSAARGQRHAILMRAAGQAVDRFRFADARELLALTESELRGWSSRYLEQSMERPLVTLQPPGGPRLLGAAVHPSGRFVAAGFGDGSLRWWNALSGNPARELDRFEYGVFGISFSPDGHWLAAGGDDSIVKLYDTETLLPVRAFDQHEYGVGWIEFSPDGSRVASIDDGGLVHLWDPATAQSLVQVEVEPRAIVLRFSPDGSEFAVADGLDGVQRFATQDGRAIGERAVFFEGQVFDLEYESDGTIWTASLDGSVQRLRWDEQGRAASIWSWYGDSAVQSIARVPEESAFYLGLKDGWVARLDPDGAVEHAFRAHFAFTNVVESDPRGRFVLTGGDDGAVQLWRPDPVTSRWSRRAQGPLVAAEVDLEGDRLLLQRVDGESEVWDLAQLSPVQGEVARHAQASSLRSVTRPQDPWRRAPFLARHPHEDLVAEAAAQGGTVVLRSQRGGDPLLELSMAARPVLMMAFLPDQDGLLVVTENGGLHFWGTARSGWPQR